MDWSWLPLKRHYRRQCIYKLINDSDTCTVNLPSDNLREIVTPRHRRLAQHCFKVPLPPYFGLSRQYLHLRQSVRRHASQVSHRFLFIPNHCRIITSLIMHCQLSDSIILPACGLLTSQFPCILSQKLNCDPDSAGVMELEGVDLLDTASDYTEVRASVSASNLF